MDPVTNCLDLPFRSWSLGSGFVFSPPAPKLVDGPSPKMSAFQEKLNYLTDAVADSNGESTLGSQQSKRHMSQTEFHAALDSEVTPPNQLR